jgi:serine/threonine protein kinase
LKEVNIFLVLITMSQKAIEPQSPMDISDLPCLNDERRPTLAKLDKAQSDNPAMAKSKMPMRRKERPKLLSMPINNRKNAMSKLVKRYHIEKHYDVGEKLGVGTYAEVRKVTDLTTNEECAVKISRGKTAVKMLQKEAEFLQSLDSEFFPKFVKYQTDEVTNKAYLFMELINGSTLASLIDSKDKLSETQILVLTKELTKAVNYLHNLGIAHRDIKPHNILVTDDNRVKLVDFGISARFTTKIADEEMKCTKFKGKFFTQVCSPLYAAPEVKSSE